MSEQEAQAQSVVREALRAGWGEAERRWPGINLAYEARRQSFVEGAEWERARHVPVEGDDEIPCAFQMEQCRCALPRGHGGLHECRRHRFSDRSLAALGGGDHAE